MPNAEPVAILLKGAGLATIPNLLSFTRIVGVTVAVILYLGGQGWLAVAIGTVAGLTDHLDGYLARRLKQETALGAMLDQAADSFTTAILLAMLVVTGGIPFAYLVIFLLREFWVGTVRRYGAAVGIEIPSIALGKLATAVIYWAILTVAVVKLPDIPARIVTPVHWIGLVGLGMGLAVSCLTGWRYTIALRGKMA
ncbi:MAG: CDP-alcohol phosphatidyltransferase family protein [Gammaproteobacteria bacterium]